jgi:hypothetical protein
MALPTYDKTKRKKSFQALPKDAYVVKIKSAREDTWPSGDRCLRIAFDIAEGEYKDFYQKQFDSNPNEDKKWPMDAVFTLNIPSDGSQQYVWDNWNTFFADLEDSNGGFAFGGDLKTLKGKVIGGLFHIRQSENNGTVYDHIVMKWTRPADDVRSGKFGKLPNDKLIGDGKGRTSATTDADGFMVIPDGEDEEFPF